MRSLRRRLDKLEAATPGVIDDGPWHWPAKAAEVEQCAMRSISSEDRTLLEELFSIENALQQNRFIETHRVVWKRWSEAFEWATRKVPAPYAMTVYDRLGWD